MWLAPIAHLLALSAMAPAAETASSVSTRALPEPIATRQTLFAIPFRIDPADQPSREPVEVQLYVSGDRGASWQRYWKPVEPERRRFMFRAGADGEFWFLVRTLDRSGRLWPQRPNTPELKVVVDTMPPKLQLEAEQGQAGQITARWQVDDAHSQPGSLTIQYRTTSDGPWQQVAIDRPSQPASGLPQTGQVTWWTQAGSGKIQIRAEVSDTAGNLAVSHAQVKLGEGAGGSPARTAEKPRSGWRASVPGPADTAWPAERSADNLGADDPSGPAPTGPANVDTRDTSQRYGNPGYAADGYTDDRYAEGRYPDTGASQSVYPYTPTEAPSSLDRREGLDPPTGSLASSVNPPIRNRYVAPFEPQASPPESGLPPGQRPRMVSSREFQLEYDVTSVGPSGIARVELWGTQDGGRTWRLLGLDDDNRSPLPVKLDQEGIYGLKVLVTSGAGLGSGRPQTGELPEIVVGVDLTKPAARITAARQGTGAESGKLIICWQADDQRLAARPVSLEFSERPGGPWTTIASGLENTGRYIWPLDHRAPQAIYLRLEVRDEAGNVGVFETDEPVSLDRFRPTAQIRGVRPLGDSNRSPAGRYDLP